MRRERPPESLRGSALPLAAAALLALALKAWYAGASADGLAWMLSPTARLAGLLSGQRFEEEPGVGWLGREAALVIAPACAGVNHLVIAFCLLAFGFAPRQTTGPRRWAWLPAALVLAYGTTLLANAARIALAIELREAPLPAWLSAAQVHRLAGVGTYLASLWLLAFAAARGASSSLAPRRAVLLPLVLYLGVTLGLPLANGAHARPEFFSHARVVLLASLGLTALLLAGLVAARTLRLRAAAAARTRCRASAPRRCRPPPTPRA